ncbi:NAD(P)-dependent dehydrogenase (short-subunit alcohol dehydrogenase family) [Aestuariispira insulae]|uniref:NAD(P)-dependent dehydrogenase (Short-subunit alcohol dehydrogenase family) n=2 Tax=Aestuariispira insulae TaxID=1461337 RepID=A0A3D9HGH8_9PROT|nr:NAD(P)-dependent dehydrogenase (short-subunit alcohol dehydrogenase family) [Aestuariispira insulae]
MRISLEGKRAFVSAGGAGMGRATCLAFRDLGAEVFTCDIDGTALESLPDDIHAFTCDVAEPDAVANLMAEVTAGGLDILVNNAGIAGPTAPVEQILIEDWQRTQDICLNAQFYFARAAIPAFKRAKGGVIINLVSAAGIMGFPNRAPYVAAKWAVTGFTKTLAMELGPANIRVNGIVPGNVNGERMERVIRDHAAADGIAEEKVRALYAIGTSMQCYVDPEEIAGLIAFLASDHGRHISGQIIGVDGHTETLFPRIPA